MFTKNYRDYEKRQSKKRSGETILESGTSPGEKKKNVTWNETNKKVRNKKERTNKTPERVKHDKDSQILRGNFGGSPPMSNRSKNGALRRTHAH